MHYSFPLFFISVLVILQLTTIKLFQLITI